MAEPVPGSTAEVQHEPAGGEAKAFGLIDEVFDKRPDAGEDGGTGAGDVTPA